MGGCPEARVWSEEGCEAKGRLGSWTRMGDPLPTSQAARAPHWVPGYTIWPARRRLFNTARSPTVRTTAGTCPLSKITTTSGTLLLICTAKLHHNDLQTHRFHGSTCDLIYTFSARIMRDVLCQS